MCVLFQLPAEPTEARQAAVMSGSCVRLLLRTNLAEICDQIDMSTLLTEQLFQHGVISLEENYMAEGKYRTEGVFKAHTLQMGMLLTY